MTGRVYRWRGRLWRVLARWRTPPLAERTSVCPECGRIDHNQGPWSWVCECVPMPDARYRLAVRNVLIEDVETGERVVRPLRGLRRPV